MRQGRSTSHFLLFLLFLFSFLSTLSRRPCPAYPHYPFLSFFFPNCLRRACLSGGTGCYVVPCRCIPGPEPENPDPAEHKGYFCVSVVPFCPFPFFCSFPSCPVLVWVRPGLAEEGLRKGKNGKGKERERKRRRKEGAIRTTNNGLCSKGN